MICWEHIDPKSQTRISLILLVNCTPDDSLLTIDVAGSQYSHTHEEEFEMLLKKLQSQIDIALADSVTR